MNQPRFYHFNRVTFVYLPDGRNRIVEVTDTYCVHVEGDWIYVGAAMESPSEPKYDKNKGREIARNRALWRPTMQRTSMGGNSEILGFKGRGRIKHQYGINVPKLMEDTAYPTEQLIAGQLFKILLDNLKALRFDHERKGTIYESQGYSDYKERSAQDTVAYMAKQAWLRYQHEHEVSTATNA